MNTRVFFSPSRVFFGTCWKVRVLTARRRQKHIGILDIGGDLRDPVIVTWNEAGISANSTREIHKTPKKTMGSAATNLSIRCAESAARWLFLPAFSGYVRMAVLNYWIRRTARRWISEGQDFRENLEEKVVNTGELTSARVNIRRGKSSPAGGSTFKNWTGVVELTCACT